MLVSLKWLREYVDLPADLDVDAFAHRLTIASSEVEGIERVGDWDRDLVIVAAVLAVDPHPDADRLRLATVDYGGAEPQTVVCGAPNVTAGQRVAFAREGAELIDPRSGTATRLKRATIRGVESSGMVLSERELGLSEEHEGILELPADAPVGVPLADYLGDVVLDAHIWPNRADTMSMVGIAREVAAIEGAALRLPDDAYAEGEAPVEDVAAVAIADPELCARYVATVVEGVRIGPSPQWLQERLRAAGQRPINNVVDVTNYVMLELGNPLHAFDADRLRGTIVVRLARDGERMTTLDGEDRELSPDTLLITDDSGPIALAGVMGSADSEVSAATTSVLLEAAQFDPASVRRTSTRLRLRSEASSRFERGLSPELAVRASRRATKLLVEVCGGTARRGVVDVYPSPRAAPEVTLPRARLDTVLGFHVETAEVESILGRLGFEFRVEGEEDEGEGKGEGAERFVVRAPWWRTDIAIADDLAEEVVRIAGYERLPATAVRGRVPAHERAPLPELRDAVRERLAAAGLQEVITYSLTTAEALARVRPEDGIAPLRLRNLLSSEHAVMRTSLRHALLEVVERNLRAGASEIAVFEAARVYLPRRGAGGPLPEERELVAGALCGAERDHWGGASERALDFFDGKGVLDELADRLGVDFAYEPSAAPDAEPDADVGLLAGRTARVRLDGVTVGVLGEVHPDLLAALDVAEPVMLFELDLASLLAQLPERRGVTAVPRFPAVEQDLALVVTEDVAAGALQATIEGSPLVAEARVFDVYRGDQLPPGMKSVAFAIRYQAPDRTLTTEDANREQARIIQRLERQHGAAPRA